MKAPRLIDIPLELHDTVRSLYRKAQWSDERIAAFTAATLVEIQRGIADIERTIADIVRKFVPPDLASFVVDRDSMVVLSAVAGDDRNYQVPKEHLVNMGRLLDEITLRKEAAKLAGLPAMKMAEEVQESTGRIYGLIGEQVPQCKSGTWTIDIVKMVMVEILEERQKDPGNPTPGEGVTEP